MNTRMHMLLFAALNLALVTEISAKKSCSSFKGTKCEKKGCDWSKTGDAQFKTCKEFAEGDDAVEDATDVIVSGCWKFDKKRKCERKGCDWTMAGKRFKSCNDPAPTAPTAAPSQWDIKPGCCRAGGEKADVMLKKTYFTVTATDADAMCANQCAANLYCTAYEMTKKKAKKNKSAQSKFICELHDSAIDSASRSTKSCRAATTSCNIYVSGRLTEVRALAAQVEAGATSIQLKDVSRIEVGAKITFSNGKNEDTTKVTAVKRGRSRRDAEPGDLTVDPPVVNTYSADDTTTVLVSFPPVCLEGQLCDTNFNDAIANCLSEDPVGGECASSPYGPMASWDVGSITDFSDAFGPEAPNDNSPYYDTYGPNDYGTSKDNVFNADVTAWNTSAATTFEKMFYYTVDFNQELNEWDTGAATTFASMFRGAAAFNGNIKDWNTEAATSFQSMFKNAEVFNQELNEWKTGAVTTFAYMFNNAAAFNSELKGWDTGAATTFEAMFSFRHTGRFMTSAFNQELNEWDTGAATTFEDMFHNAAVFNQELNEWNTGASTSFLSMFNGAAAFNQELNEWDTGAVTTFAYMFEDAAAFNGIIKDWNTEAAGSTATYAFSAMFNGAAAFNQELNDWKTGAATSFYQMFKGAAAFNQELNEWDTGAAKAFGYMFSGAAAFDQDVSGWNTQAATSFEGMFWNTAAFNQPLNEWNTSAATSFHSTFMRAYAFNQPLNEWDTGAATRFPDMFTQSGSTCTLTDAATGITNCP